MSQLDPAQSHLPFTEFLAYLKRQGFIIGVDHYIRLQAVLNTLEHDDPTPELKYVLCPLFATNQQQQQQFYQVFDSFFKPFEPSDREQLLPSETQAQQPARKPSVPITLQKWPYIVVAIVLLIGIIFLSNKFPPPPRPEPTPSIVTTPIPTPALPTHPPSPTPVPDIAAVTPTPIPTIPDQSEISPAPTFYQTYWRIMRWAGITAPIILLLLSGLYQSNRRRLVLQKQQGKALPCVWPIQIEPPVPGFLKQEPFWSIARLLRQRFKSEVYQFDATQTIQATITSLGFPALRYKALTKPPEYLLLIDRPDYHDHYAHLLDNIVNALQNEDVSVTRYFYEHNPRICFRDTSGERVYLSDLKEKLGDYRLILFGNGEELLDPVSGELDSWTNLFHSWQNRAILTSVRPQQWGMREVRLAQEFVVLPASLDGLTAVVNYFESPSEPDLKTWKDHDGQTPMPSSDTVGDVMTLHTYLGADVFQWLCACAVYPELHWDLTLYLGALPCMPEHLLSEENLLRVIALPWFRNGFMPDMLREALINRLDQEKWQAIRASILDVLERSAATKDTVAGDPYRLNVVVQKWMLAHLNLRDWQERLKPHKPVHRNQIVQDYTLLRFLEATPKSPLHFVLPERFRKILYRRGNPGFGFKPGIWIVATAVVITLAAFLIPAPDSVKIWGTVRDTDHHILQGAQIQVGNVPTITDQNGHFDIVLPFNNQKRQQPFIVSKEGYQSWKHFVSSQINQEANVFLNQDVTFPDAPISLGQPVSIREAGGKAFARAAQIMAFTSIPGEALDVTLQTFLRPFFGDLIAKVNVHWNTDLIKEWSYADYIIPLEDAETEAQTYGYEIYIKSDKSQLDELTLVSLLIHQMTHVRQYEQLGQSLSEFGARYFEGYLQGGNVYVANPMEQEAILNVIQMLTSAFTLQNATSEIILYQVRWIQEGTLGDWTTQTLQPNMISQHSIKGMGWAQILLTSGTRIDLRAGPSVGENNAHPTSYVFTIQDNLLTVLAAPIPTVTVTPSSSIATLLRAETPTSQPTTTPTPEPTVKPTMTPTVKPTATPTVLTQAPTVKLIVNPNKTDVLIGADPIMLTAKSSGSNLKYTWSLQGPGTIEGEGAAIFYKLPGNIGSQSAQAVVTVIVTDDKGQEGSDALTFNILAKGEPPPILLTQGPTVKLIVNPNKTDISIWDEPIALTAKASGTNLKYKWSLQGPGEIEGEGSAVFYNLPDNIEVQSVQAVVTVTVVDDKYQEASDAFTFNILAKGEPEPTVTPGARLTPTARPTVSDQALPVQLIADPNKTNLSAGTDPIVLRISTSGSNLKYTWSLQGAGAIEGEGAAVFYRPPDTIEGQSVQAVVTAIVTDRKGQKGTDTIAFNIFAQTVKPTAKPTVSGPAVKLIVNPNKTDVLIGADPIALTVKASGSNLKYKWSLQGSGAIEGEGAAVFYRLPETIEGQSALAVVTVIVTDDKGQEGSDAFTFNILAKGESKPTVTPGTKLTPTAKPTAKPTATPPIEASAKPTLPLKPTATPTPKPTAIPTPSPQAKIALRSQPLNVSENEVQKIFGLDGKWQLREYIENQFEVRGDIVVDHATGLMWEQSGSNAFAYQDGQAYIARLNSERFGGYADWRLPTVPELLSLMEPEKQLNGLYINPIFDNIRQWCWSSDIHSSESAWLVGFEGGGVYANDISNEKYVRAVRSWQEKPELTVTPGSELTPTPKATTTPRSKLTPTPSPTPYPHSKPTITLTSVVPSETEQDTLVVRGVATDSQGIAMITIAVTNGGITSRMTIEMSKQPEEPFNITVPLDVGLSEITIGATNLDGQKEAYQVRVLRKTQANVQPTNTPTVTISPTKSLPLPTATPPSTPITKPTPTPIPTPTTTPAPMLTTAVLTVRSNVYDDVVFIDGQRQTKATPLTVDLAFGEHLIRVEKEGYAPFEQTISLQNALTVRATLNRLPTPTPTITPTVKPTAKPTVFAQTPGVQAAIDVAIIPAPSVTTVALGTGIDTITFTNGSDIVER